MIELVLLSSIILLLMYSPSNLLSALRVLLCSQSFLPAVTFQSMHRWLNTNSLTGQRHVKFSHRGPSAGVGGGKYHRLFDGGRDDHL